MEARYSLVSFLGGLILLTAILVVCLGWDDRVKRWRELNESWWVRAASIVSLILVSLSTILYVFYAGHNMSIWGDRNGSAIALRFIRSGLWLALLGTIFSLGARGRVRWTTFTSGCLIFLFWFGQGMSL